MRNPGEKRRTWMVLATAADRDERDAASDALACAGIDHITDPAPGGRFMVSVDGTQLDAARDVWVRRVR